MEKENLVQITYWSINKPSISIVFCILLFTAIFCFAAMAYADKATVKIAYVKNAVEMEDHN